jgi:hypothetical protein
MFSVLMTFNSINIQIKLKPTQDRGIEKTFYVCGKVSEELFADSDFNVDRNNLVISDKSNNDDDDDNNEDHGLNTHVASAMKERQVIF